MSELSRISQTILDYATSSAKRSWSPSVSEVHLVDAIRRWDDQWFEVTFPGLTEKLAELLTGSRGDTMKPERVDDAVLDHLKAVKDEHSLKTLAVKIVEGLQPEFDRVASESTDARSTPPTRTATQSKGVEENSGKKGDPKSVSTRVVDRGLLLSSEFAARIAALLGDETTSISRSLASDGLILAHRVLGLENQLVSTALSEALLIDDAIQRTGADLSGILQRLVAHSDPEAPRVATKLALAYVDLAEYAASMDDVVTNEELEQIDSIRLECRQILGDRIDASSDAMIEFERSFSSLIGLNDVKRDLRKRVDFLMVNQRRAARGLHTTSHRMHMAFVGNPGTGKTTVARLFAKLLRSLGILSSDQIVEVDRSGLVGQYVGHSEEKTQSVIAKADGGVLFIDEAYALNDRYGEDRKGFGEEATDVLVKAMEDRRDSLMVILAGYKGPMDNFISMNPGLKSRIPAIIEFGDYSTDELLEIADSVATQRHLTIADDARKKLGAILSVGRGTEGFGNAREVENLIDTAQRNLTRRIAPLGNLATEEESGTIREEDVPEIPQNDQPTQQKTIGFRRAN